VKLTIEPGLYLQGGAVCGSKTTLSSRKPPSKASRRFHGSSASSA